MVIRLVKEMPITLRMDKDRVDSNSLNRVSKILEINRTELETKWDNKVSQVKVLILAVIVDSKASKMVVVHRASLRDLDLVTVKVIILMAIMTERRLLKVL